MKFTKTYGVYLVLVSAVVVMGWLLVVQKSKLPNEPLDEKVAIAPEPVVKMNPDEVANDEKTAIPAPEPEKTAPEAAKPKKILSLQQIIDYPQKSWAARWVFWHRKKAPDFSFTDLKSQQHKLSDYRGKDVMLVFWATWCGPCKIEIPDLIELRKKIGPDQLEIIGISNESEAKLKPFVAGNKINYTVTSIRLPLPAPFNSVASIPTTFFINKEGKIKLGAMGLVPLAHSIAVLEATE